MTQTTTTINRVIESDLMAHIEDTKLFWVTREGRPVRRSWNMLSDAERALQIEAAERAAYNSMFNIY